MKWLFSKLIGRFLLVWLFLLACSLSGFCLDTTSPQSVPGVALLDLSLDGSTSPQTSKPQMEPLPPLPEQQTTPLDDSQPISEQRRQALVKWISFWEDQVKPWYNQVTTSWSKAKSSFDKQNESTDATVSAKDKEIAALKDENTMLKVKLDRADADKWLFGFLGFAGGAVATEGANIALTKR